MPSSYEALLEHLRRLDAIGRAAGVLRWDQQVMMPPKGAPARAGELAALDTLQHERFASERTERLVEAATKEANTPEEHALLREVRRDLERALRVPDELVEALSQATSEAYQAWLEAKGARSFATFAPALEDVLELQRAVADAIDPSEDPYIVLFQEHEPWLDYEQARASLAALRDGLVELLDHVPEPSGGDPLAGHWPTDQQRRLCEDLLDTLGYDRSRGRLDESPHPFSTGNVHDARVTTRFEPDDPLSAVTSTAHEFGHALYTLGLPTATFGTPLGKARNLVVHESQSRLWENHVVRSKAFAPTLLSLLQTRFPDRIAGLDEHALYARANQVEPTLVRVDADELTYHLHIVLRTELEAQLVRGELAIDELETAWNDRCETLLGLRPGHAAEGVLQDVHWSHGAFGYFPTYSLGSMLSAQIVEAFEQDARPLEPLVAQGAFGRLRAWLQENVHAHGRRYTTPELIERATGSPLSPDAFLAYAEAKYMPLWG